MSQLGGECFIKEPLINKMIRAKSVRLINAEGQQVGVVTTQEALKMAEDQGLDLVEVSPDANPPVCKIINFGKYRYEITKRSKEAKKNQKCIILKEIKLNPKIGEHDLFVKIDHMRKFIEAGHKVKISVNFKGRLMAHPEFGNVVINKIIDELKEIITIDTPAKMEGNQMVMFISSSAKTEV